MAEYTKTKRSFAQLAKPKVGSFALDASVITWKHCREQFASKFDNSSKGFYFSHPPGKGQNIAEFITLTEKILKLKQYSTFSETTSRSVLWIMPSPFWKTCYMRRSLLTILMRCGTDYDIDKKNYEEALYSVDYVRITEKAVKRFLFGFTDFINDRDVGNHQTNGWVSAFRGKNNIQIRQCLVNKLNNKKKAYSFIGSETLWT